MGGISFKSLIKETNQRWTKYQAWQHAAAVAFYAVLSLPSLFLMIVLYLSFIIGPEFREVIFIRSMAAFIDPEIVNVLSGSRNPLYKLATSFGANWLSLIILIVSASLIFIQVQRSFNNLWGVVLRKTKKTSSLLWQKRVVMVISVLVLFTLLALSLSMEMVFSSLSVVLSGSLIAEWGYLRVINHISNTFFTVIFFAAVFKLLPDVYLNWEDAIIGGFVTSLMFVIGKNVLDFTLWGLHAAGGSGVNTFLLFLLWIYYCSLIIFWGAQFTYVYAKKHGHRIRALEYSRLLK